MARPVTDLIGIVIPQRTFEESLRYAKTHRMNQSLVLAHAWDVFSVSEGFKKRAQKLQPYFCKQDKGTCTDQFGLANGSIGCASTTICEHKYRRVRKLRCRAGSPVRYRLKETVSHGSDCEKAVSHYTNKLRRLSAIKKPLFNSVMLPCLKSKRGK